jgi:16S rRNA (guanine966-N2)-methyltransferase
MRIVGGRLRGRRLEAPAGRDLRPSADRTREALFNLLTQGRVAAAGPTLQGARVLDAFAGTGALGLEARSRGADTVVFMESAAAALAALRANIRKLGEGAACDVIPADVLRPPRPRRPCDILLMDPPYGQGLAAPALQALAAAGWIAAGGLVAVELMRGESLDPPQGFEVLETRHYGKAQLVFLRAP